jgi:hypothetical protein
MPAEAVGLREEAIVEGHDYRKFSPGDRFRLRLDVKPPAGHIEEAGLAFGTEAAGGRLPVMGGPSDVTREYRTPGQPYDRITLDVTVPPGPPGVWRVARAWIRTVGGHLHDYEGEDLGTLGRFGFELVEEPTQKPSLSLSYGTID